MAQSIIFQERICVRMPGFFAACRASESNFGLGPWQLAGNGEATARQRRGNGEATARQGHGNAAITIHNSFKVD